VAHSFLQKGFQEEEYLSINNGDIAKLYVNSPTMHRIGNLSFIKKLVFSFVPLIVLLLFAELGWRCFYFQVHSDERFALVYAVKFCRETLAARRLAAVREQAFKEIAEMNKALDVPKHILYTTLFRDEGTPVLDEFKKKYENSFVSLLKEVRKINSKFILLYPPSYNYIKNSVRRKISRDFYAALAKKYGVSFVDLTDEFLKYPPETVTYLPEDGHLSRFGNKLVARKLSKTLNELAGYRANFTYTSRGKFFGDLDCSVDTVRNIIPNMPYRVVTNSQGLRMNYDITFPKKRQRVLILGDSYTFGLYVSNQDTYAALLDANYPDIEVINAGVEGYTITDEAAMFAERAKYTEPDITVLQALDNDLTGLFAFKLNQINCYNKHRRVDIAFPSENEKKLINKLRDRLHKR